MVLDDGAQVFSATRELILLTELLNNGRGQPRMELDQATASDPCKQACPITTGWSGRPESCYGSDAPRSKRVPVACPIGRQTSNSRSLPAKRTRRPNWNGPALRNQATDLLC